MSEAAQQNTTPIKRRKRVWEKAFLASLSKTANVSKSCELVEIERSTAYDLRNTAEDFKEAWDNALEVACDALELEARRRAEEGVRKTIFYQGDPIGEEINYSDTLMIFLLKAHRPKKFRDVVHLDVSKLTDEELEEIAQG